MSKSYISIYCRFFRCRLRKFIIPTNLADTSTLKVKIQNSSSDTTTNTYTKSNTLTELNGTSKVYFLQEQDDGRFEVYFGDGTF